MAALTAVDGRGVEISVADRVGMEKTAYSVGEYPKHTVSLSKKDIARAV